MKVTVFGIGYVGLVQGTCLAEAGHDVVCVDVDAQRVENLKNGVIPIYEPGLEPMVTDNYKSGRLNFTTDAAAAVQHGDIQFIAVGTPPDEDGSADLKYVLTVARTIAEHMNGYKIIINKSTVPVGTADRVHAAVAEVLEQRFPGGPHPSPLPAGEGAATKSPHPSPLPAGEGAGTGSPQPSPPEASDRPAGEGAATGSPLPLGEGQGEGIKPTFDVVSNPEFLKEGAAVNDCMRPDRIVIGTDSERAEEALRELYAPFNRNHDKMIVMDVRSAELTKYAANCMLATKISFMNEIANLAERLGADVEAVRQGIGSDPRIGYQFIYPGIGYGGSCFPKDVQALIRTADGIDFEASILKAVEARNYDQKTTLFRKIDKHYGGNLKGKTFALWGLSFKPNTDDMREAPSRVLMEALWDAGAKVQAFDPEAMEETQRLYGHRDDLTLSGTKESALKGADALVIVTEWQAFRAPDFDRLREQLTEPLIFDGRNLYEPARMKAKGFRYYAVGRQPV